MAGAGIVLLGVLAWAVVDPNRPLLAAEPEPADPAIAATA